MKTVASILVVLFLAMAGMTGCASTLQASATCVSALGALGVTISDATGSGAADLSSILAILLASGHDISAAVEACSAIFAEKTQKNLGAVVTKKAAVEIKAGPGKAARLPSGPIKVRIQ